MRATTIICLGTLIALCYVCLQASLLFLNDSISNGYEYNIVKLNEVIPGTSLEFVGCEFHRSDPYTYIEPVLRDRDTGEIRKVFLGSLHTPVEGEDVILSYVYADFKGMNPDGSFEYDVRTLLYGAPKRSFLLRLWKGLRYPLNPWKG